MSARHRIRLVVNEVEHELLVEPRRTLADALREDLGLTGTHLGCEHGVCGACTVRVDGVTVRSCLMFAVQADGARILTVEGLARDGRLHPLQQAFSEEHGLQCGFCTPGILLAAHELLERDPAPTREAICEALSGNLCRCTGYRDIVRAVESAARKLAAGGASGSPAADAAGGARGGAP